MTGYVDDIILTCPTKQGRRARPINIPDSKSKDAPMELHKTGEEIAAQHNDSLYCGHCATSGGIRSLSGAPTICFKDATRNSMISSAFY